MGNPSQPCLDDTPTQPHKMSGVFSGNQWTTSSGSTWSVVIEPDFVNQVAELCNHLALASAESRSASEELVTKAQAAGGADGTAEQRGQLVKEVLNAVATRGLNPGAEPKDLEGFTNLAVALISTTFEGQDAEELFTQLAEGVAKNASSESSATINARYNSLSSLYNSLPSSASSNTRSAIVLRLFKLAVSRDDLTTLSTPLAALPQWLSSEWGITESSESDKLMGQFVEILEGSSSASETGETSEAVRKLLLEYCNQNTSDELKSKLLLHTLSSTTIHDIESLPSASSASTAANLEQLRDIFLSGSAADLSSFLSSNQASLPPSFAPEKLEEKLQYIILADYCSKKVGQTISYDEVASVLGLEGKGDEEDRAMEVEGWVIATIRAKLLTARLHQPSSSVSIMRATPRRFGAEQWQILQQRLESWKSSISNILEVVGRAVGPAPQRHQAQQQQQHDATALVQAADNVSNEQQQQVEVA